MSLGDLWSTAAADHEGDAKRRLLIAARTQVLPLWPFLAEAQSPADFVNRKALVAGSIDSACNKVADGAEFAVLRHEVDASLDADFRIIFERRQAEQQRVNAHRAWLRSEGRDKDPVCPQCGSAAITYSKAKLYGGKTSKCSHCGHTFDQEHAYAQSSLHAASDYKIEQNEQGKHQVRVRQHPGGPGTEPMWFDAGDPADTREEAERKMEEFKKSSAARPSHEMKNADESEAHPMWRTKGDHGENTSHPSNTPEGGTHNGPRSNCPICASKTSLFENKGVPITNPEHPFTLSPDDVDWIGNFTDEALAEMERFWTSTEGQNLQSYHPGGAEAYANGTLDLIRKEKARRAGMTAALKKGAASTTDSGYLDDFVDAYVTAALWTGTDDDENPLDDNYDESDVDQGSISEARQLCQQFVQQNAADLDASGMDASRAGHNFYLNSHGHGSGFWDEDGVPDDIRKRLDAACDRAPFSQITMSSYVGDDGKVYIASKTARTASLEDILQFTHPQVGYKTYQIHSMPGEWATYWPGTPGTTKRRVQLFRDESASGIGTPVETVEVSGDEEAEKVIRRMLNFEGAKIAVERADQHGIELFKLQARNHAKRNGHDMGDYETKSYKGFAGDYDSKTHRAECKTCGAEVSVSESEGAGSTYSGRAISKKCGSKTAGVVIDETWSEDDKRKLLAGMAEFDKLNGAWLDGFHLGRQTAKEGSIARAAITAGLRGGMFETGFEDGYNAVLRQEAFRKGAPFAGYKDFDECVSKNRDKDDPEAYCGSIKHKVEDKKSSRKIAAPDDMGPLHAPGDPLARATATCAHCGRPIEDDDGIWYHPDTMSARCDGPDDEEGLAWSDMIRQAEPATTASRHHGVRQVIAASDIHDAVRQHAEHQKGILKPGDRVGDHTVTNVGTHTVQFRTDDGWDTSVQIPFKKTEQDSEGHWHERMLPSHERAANASKTADLGTPYENNGVGHGNADPARIISVNAWADGFGNWHVAVETNGSIGSEESAEWVATQRLYEELDARSGPGGVDRNVVGIALNHRDSKDGRLTFYYDETNAHEASRRTAGDKPPWLDKDKSDDDPDKAKPEDKPKEKAEGDEDKTEGVDDPSQMQPGQQVTLHYTLTGSAEGAGDCPASFENFDGTTATFKYEKGTFGVTNNGGKWVDSAGTEFTFSAGTAAGDPNAQQQPPQQGAPAPGAGQPPVQSKLEMVVTLPDGSRVGTSALLEGRADLDEAVRQSADAIKRHPRTAELHVAADEFQIGDHVRVSGGFEDGITGVIVANEPKTGEEISQMSGNSTVGYDRPYRYRIKVDGSDQELGGLHPINLDKIGSRHPFDKTAAKVHEFESTGEAYNRSQYDESIADGDLLIVPSEGVAGYLMGAWPVAVTSEHGSFHALDTPGAGPRGQGYKVCQTCHGSGQGAPGANAPHRQEGDTSCWGCGGKGGYEGDSPEQVRVWHDGWRQARDVAQQHGWPLDGGG